MGTQVRLLNANANNAPYGGGAASSSSSSSAAPSRSSRLDYSEFEIVLAVSDLEVVVDLLLAVDKGGVANLTLGSIGDAPLQCIGSMLERIGLPKLELGASNTVCS